MDCPLCGTHCTCSVPSVAARVSQSRGTLTTSETVDILRVSIFSEEPGPRMHSAEPDQPEFVRDSSQSAADQESWRADVASRVNSYRARRKCKSSDEMPALDFGPADPSPIPGVPRRHVPWNPEAQSSARNPFDTNYYRRLNSESLNAGSIPQSSGSGAALAAAPVENWEAAPEEQSIEDFLGELQTPTSEEQQIPDLEMHSVVSGDPLLDRYRIAGAEDIAEPEVAPIPEPQTSAQAALEAATQMVQGNLIVFPRPLLEPPLAPQPSRDELAEPMHSRPRILEVPEDIMPAVQGSLFPEIRLDAGEQESSSQREPEFEIPLGVALIPDRILASLVDTGAVMAAGMLFACIAWYALPGIPHTKPFFMVLGAVTLLLWAVYQHLFLLYAGRTPGMSWRGIRLSTFDGSAPPWEQRRSRAIFMCISLASVMLGFLWAMVDEEMLCWHDRISRTFPTIG